MTDWIIFILLFGEIVIFARLDRVRFGTWMTPFSLLAFPYLTVVSLVFVFGPAWDYVPLYMPSVLIWIAGLAVFWIAGQTSAPIHLQPPSVMSTTRLRDNEKASRTPLVMLVFLTAAICLYSYRQAIASVGGIQSFRNSEFAMTYSRGMAGHFLVFDLVLVVILLGTATRAKSLTTVLFCIAFALTLIQPVKGWVMLPLCAGLFYRLSTGRLKASVVRAAAAVLIFYVLFLVPYLIEFAGEDPGSLVNKETYVELTRHFGDYLSSGVLTLSSYVQSGITRFPTATSAVAYGSFQNMLSLVTRDAFVSPIVQDYTLIRDVGRTHWSTNVHTLFGALALSIGYAQSVLYTLILGVLSYGLFGVAYRRQNPWIMTAWCFWASGLAFSWFDIYFSSLTFIEVPAYCFLLSFLLRARRTHPQDRFTAGRGGLRDGSPRRAAFTCMLDTHADYMRYRSDKGVTAKCQ